MLCVSYKETASINDVECSWMTDVEHLVNEIVECVDLMKEIDRGPTSSTRLEDAISELVCTCKELSEDLVDTKDDERSLLAWRALLVEADESFGRKIREAEKAGGKPTAADGRKIAAMNGEIETCMKLISEMLYILNPHAHPPAAAREVGMQQGRMPEMAEMRALLGRL